MFVVVAGGGKIGVSVTRTLLALGHELAVVEPAGLDSVAVGDGPTLTLPAGRGRLHTLRPWTGEVQLRTVRLVMPAEANIALGQISILTPVGAGLYGLMAGQSIDWPDLEGRDRRIKILAVKQPERAN